MNEPIAETLRRLIDASGVSENQLQRETGVNQPTINRILKGESKDPKTRNLKPLADYFGITLSQMRGEQPIPEEVFDRLARHGVNAGKRPGNVAGFSRKPPKTEETGHPIPVQLKRVSIVGTAQLGPNGYWEELQYPVGHGDGFVDASTGDPNAFAVRVVGDSMRPRIKDGEFVVISPNREPLPGDEVLVKTKDGQSMVKELLHIRDGVVALGSVNEAHGRRNIPLEQIEKMHCVHAIMPKGSFVPS